MRSVTGSVKIEMVGGHFIAASSDKRGHAAKTSARSPNRAHFLLLPPFFEGVYFSPTPANPSLATTIAIKHAVLGLYLGLMGMTTFALLAIKFIRLERKRVKNTHIVCQFRMLGEADSR